MFGIQLGRGVQLARRITATSLSGYKIHRIDKSDRVVLQVKTPEGRLIVSLKFNQDQWEHLTKP